MLSIKCLTIKHQQIPLFKADFQLSPSSIVALSGPNGSGKSTLLRTMVGLRDLSHARKSLDLDGHSVETKTYKQKVFYFESVNWFDQPLTGRDYLKLYNRLWQADTSLIEELINFWQMVPYIDQPIRKYSLGMKQKLLISLYGVTDTAYWLMDEPTNGLDQESLARLKDYFRAQKQAGRAILMATHEQEAFVSLCDSIYTIEGQRLVEKGGHHHETH